MADQGGEFSIFQGNHVRIDISMSIRPVITKFGKQVHLQDLVSCPLSHMFPCPDYVVL